MSHPPIPAGTWSVDTAHSSVAFSVRHMMVAKVRGRFTSFDADIVTGEDVLDSRVTASVDVASVDTNDPTRDGHLRTGDFFDASSYPTMTFTSTGIEGSGDTYRLHGDLTIKGVTRPVTFELEVGGVGKDPMGNTKAGFTAEATISRKDFGMEYNAALETGGVLIGDKVSIVVDIEAQLEQAAAGQAA